MYFQTVSGNALFCARRIVTSEIIQCLGGRPASRRPLAMVLGIELPTDYLILDDATARREALRLGLTVKGTLAILKTMANLALVNKETLYQQLLKVNFRVKRKIFDDIFRD